MRTFGVYLSVNVAAMTDSIDSQNLCVVIDLIEHAIHTNSDTPIVPAACQFPASARMWIVGQLSNRGNYSGMEIRTQSIQILLSVSLEKNLMHVPSSCARPNILRAADIAPCPPARV